MNHSLLLFASLAIMILASSCNKTQPLINQRAEVEAEIQRINEEIRTLDAKFEALRTSPVAYGMTFEAHQKQAATQNAKLEAELANFSKRCTGGETALGVLRPRLEAYKAKYLR
jgi:outer membrane murein-binding lipoprotein Lpp